MAKPNGMILKRKWLRNRRIELKLTQSQLGTMTGIYRSDIARIETGKTYLHPGWILKLSAALRRSERWVVSGR